MKLCGIFDVDCSKGRIVINPDLIKETIHKWGKSPYKRASSYEKAGKTKKYGSKKNNK